MTAEPGRDVEDGWDEPAATAEAVATPPTATSRTPDLAFTIALLLIFAGALLLARQWGFRASLVPTLVSGVGVALSAVHLGLVLTGRTRSATAVPAATDPDVDDHDPAHVFATTGAASWRACLAWIAGFFAGVYVVGLLVTAVVFTAAYLRLSARAGWRSSAVYAIALGLVLWLGFVELLAIQLPEGVLG